MIRMYACGMLQEKYFFLISTIFNFFCPTYFSPILLYYFFFISRPFIFFISSLFQQFIEIASAVVIEISGLKDMLQNILNNKTQAKFAEHLRFSLNLLSCDMTIILGLVRDHINSFSPYNMSINFILLKINKCNKYLRQLFSPYNTNNNNEKVKRKNDVTNLTDKNNMNKSEFNTEEDIERYNDKNSNNNDNNNNKNNDNINNNNNNNNNNKNNDNDYNNDNKNNDNKNNFIYFLLNCNSLHLINCFRL